MNKSPIPDKGFASEPTNLPLSQETVQSLQELGEVLRQIHNRLLSEGYIIKDGEILEPKASDPNNGANH